jgi:murein DD-endopeptidase MepM/ murein hydrolase activator NlpD
MFRRPNTLRSALLGATTAALFVGWLLLLPVPSAIAHPRDGASAGASPGARESADLFEETAREAGCDPTADGEADVEELVGDEPADRTIETPRPTRWRTSRGRQCRRYHGRAFCDGPRRVPEPHGAAAELAQTLGFDDERRLGQLALNRPPQDEWLEAVEGEQGPGLLWPVPEGRMWRGFGRHRVLIRRRGGRLRRGRRHRLHRGVDIGAEAGSQIRAVNDGLVLYSYNGMRGYGNAVVLLHPDGSVTLYAHCRATFVFAGQQVRRGQVIAEVGHTGLAHGDHLHFEWRRNGRARNPAPHFVGVPERPERGPTASR